MASSTFLASRHATFCKASTLLSKRCLVRQGQKRVHSTSLWRSDHLDGLTHRKPDVKSRLKGIQNSFRTENSTAPPHKAGSPAPCSCVQSGENRGSRGQDVRTFATAVGDNGTSESQEGETYTLTTPLYYANAAPHMGSAYPTFAADALARFQVRPNTIYAFVCQKECMKCGYHFTILLFMCISTLAVSQSLADGVPPPDY